MQDCMVREYQQRREKCRRRGRTAQTKKGVRSGIAGACQWQRTGGGRLPEEPQVTGSCGYVDDVGADHFSDFESSAAVVLSVGHVSSDESATLMQ